jgi:hypothetical protein
MDGHSRASAWLDIAIRNREEAYLRGFSLFPYEPLSLAEGSTQIRLIELLPGKSTDHLCCRIAYVNLSEGPRYEALSYCWGDPTIKRLLIVENAESLEPNFKLSITALKHLRRVLTSRVLWVDAVCINQQDCMEKNFQVGLMRDIYKKAGGTLIWIGEASDTTVVMKLLHLCPGSTEQRS